MRKRWFGLSLIAVTVVWAAAAPMAHADDVTGNITVHKQIAGEGTRAGWEFTLTSTECGVTRTGTTDTHGDLVFGELPFTVGEADCRYDLAETPVDGYTQVTPAARLSDLTPGTIVTPTSTSVALTSVAGAFTNVTRNPETSGNTLPILCLTGVGTSTVRAGAAPFTHVCNDVSTRSGLGFAGSPISEIPAGEAVLGTLTHYNQTIERGFHAADLAISITFTDNRTGQVQTINRSYTIHIDETSDTRSTCKYETEAGALNHTLPFGFGCADRLSISQPPDSLIRLTDADVNLQLSFGTVTEAGTCGSPTAVTYTAEQRNTPLCLMAHSTITPHLASGTEVTVTNASNPPTRVPDRSEPPSTSSGGEDRPSVTDPADISAASAELADTGSPADMMGLLGGGLLAAVAGGGLTALARRRG